MRMTVLYSMLVLLFGCASASGEYENTRTAAEIGCSQENLKIDKSTWVHRKMDGLITYATYCKDDKFYCSITAPFKYSCKKAID
jgi:hypothetical protein